MDRETNRKNIYMVIFGTDKNVKGCFIKMRIASNDKAGVRVYLPTGKEFINKDMVCVGFSVAVKDTFSVLQCFSDFQFITAFGHDPAASNFSASFIAFLNSGTVNTLGSPGGGGSGGSQTDIIKSVMDVYWANRISATEKRVKVTTGSSSNVFTGHIVSIDHETASAEYNLQSFRLNMILIQPQ